MKAEESMEQPRELNLSKAEDGQMQASKSGQGIEDEPESAQTKTSRPSRPRFWRYLVLSIVAAAVVAAAITVPFVVIGDDDDDQEVDGAEQGAQNGTEDGTKGVADGGEEEGEEGAGTNGTDAPPSTPRFEPLFDEKLPLMSTKVLEGYSNTGEFESELWKFAESYVNGVAGRNYGDMTYQNFGGGGMFAGRGEGAPGVSDTPELESGGDASGLDDFDTNDQEEGVREGDKVLTDGKVAVAAYGHYIVGWNVTNGAKIFKMAMEPTSDEYGGPPLINTMLLNENRLFVVLGGYGYSAQISEQRVLSDYLGTRVLVYDMDSIGKSYDKIDLLTQRDVNGYFVSVRGIGNTVHLILRSQLNMYPFLAEPYDRYSEAMSTMDLESYVEEVRTQSTEKGIPEFVNQTISEIMECGVLPQLVRLNRWTTDSQSDSTMEHYLYSEGYARSMVMIASFDLDAISVNGTEAFTCVPMAGAFFPADAWDVQVYAEASTMIMTVRGYDFSAQRNMSIDSTYIVAFGLDGASATPKAIGSAEGYVLNQYSLRVDGAILEFATTIREQFMWRTMEATEGGRGLQAPPDPEVVTIPTTENYVITANLETGDGQIKNLDRIKLGKDGEVFTTVRFYKNRAYAVTFLQMDPFYVLNMEDPNNITIAGMLDNITGWSSYLEPMNDNNTVMLAIGQETNEEGFSTGVSISVFDARDLSNVKLSARLVIESNNSFWSDSEGLREKNAIRFNAETGILILPLRFHSATYFRGFKVYTATVDSVKETCSIDLSKDYPVWYYYYLSLEPRSMIIGGSVMTTMEKDVTMTNLTSCTEEKWNLKWD